MDMAAYSTAPDCAAIWRSLGVQRIMEPVKRKIFQWRQARFVLFQQMISQDDPLDLTGAFVDAEQADIA